MLDTSKDYVFLSYSHKDDISSVLNWFEKKGYNAVYDEELSVGDIWDMKVRRHISSPKCKGVVFLISRASLVSPAILKETDYASLFRKNTACITLDNCPLTESFAALTDETEREFAKAVLEAFPPEKIFITLKDLLSEENDKLEKTFSLWDFKAEELKANGEFTALDHYTTDIEGEKERLHRQQRGYYEFDMNAITSALSAKEMKYTPP